MADAASTPVTDPTPGAFGADQLTAWADKGGELLEASRAAIDALNVFPVPDGDTGTNLWLTWQAATQALPREVSQRGQSLAETATKWSRAALLGARGNSGVILAQLLRGMTTSFVDHSSSTGTSSLSPEASAQVIVSGLARAVDLAYAGVARPVEGTILTVAAAASDAAQGAVSQGLIPTVSAAVDAAADALARTPQQLAVLAQAGVVDAGGQGLVLVLEGLRAAIDPRAPSVASVLSTYHLDAGHVEGHAAGVELDAMGAFEVMYLLETGDDGARSLQLELDRLGQSVVVVGGDGLWNVHVHTDEAGPAVEAGVAVGRVFRIKITPLTVHGHDASSANGAAQVAERVGPQARVVVAVAAGEGLQQLFGAGAAHTVPGGSGTRPTPGDLVAAAGDALEVLLLPNDDDHTAAANAAADELRARGVQVAVLPTHADVQGLAALAVHDPERSFTDDVVTMSAAAGATRFGAVTRAEREAMTSAGICRPGQLLGVVEGDIAVIGDDADEVACAVVDRMLSAGGELVTLLWGDDPQPGAPLAEAIRQHLHDTRLDIEVVTYAGGQLHYPLLIGVE